MRSWYEFTAKAETKETEIFIYDVIGSYSVSAARFIAELQSVPKDHRLILRLHSPGGSVFEGNAIFNAIKAHPGGCTTQVDGLAASMASVLAIAGSPARMAKNALMMIHNVSGYAEGGAEDLRKRAELIEKVQSTIVQAYVARTGLKENVITEMMDKETWMDADEAMKLGFVDEVTDAQDVAAFFDLAAFRNAPAGLRFDNAAGAQSPKDNRSSMPAELTPEQRLQLAQAQAQENFQALVAARTEIEGLKGQVTNLTKERDDAKAEVIVKSNELKAEQDSREETIKKQVTDRLADAGTDPVKRDPKAGAASDTKMARAEFAKLTPAAQADFCRKGGIVTEA